MSPNNSKMENFWYFKYENRTEIVLLLVPAHESLKPFHLLKHLRLE
jgi:hypothetical protein